MVRGVAPISFLLLKNPSRWHYPFDGYFAATIQTHGRAPGSAGARCERRF
jgi:hypothetical protein